MPWPPAFAINHETKKIVLSASSPEETNAAFQLAVDSAIDSGAFPSLNGLHSEPFRIMSLAGVHVERFASSLFGIATRGAHLTCFTRDEAGAVAKIWVARRSPKLFTYPGMLDSTVAGGVKAPDSPLDCIIAEADEEASLPVEMVAARVVPVGVVTLANTNVRTGLHHSEILYVYDLELRPHEVPAPHDGEVAEFVAMDCDDVVDRMRAGEFKPNVCAVMIDFLVRHGVVSEKTEPNYVDVCARLRRTLPVPTS